MENISADTRLSQVLDSVPGALDYIVSLNPNDFERLRHPMLRRYMSPRISLRRVAAMAGMSADLILVDLARLSAGKRVESTGTDPPHAAHEQSPPAQRVPAWFKVCSRAWSRLLSSWLQSRHSRSRG